MRGILQGTDFNKSQLDYRGDVDEHYRCLPASCASQRMLPDGGPVDMSKALLISFIWWRFQLILGYLQRHSTYGPTFYLGWQSATNEAVQFEPPHHLQSLRRNTLSYSFACLHCTVKGQRGLSQALKIEKNGRLREACLEWVFLRYFTSSCHLYWSPLETDWHWKWLRHTEWNILRYIFRSDGILLHRFAGTKQAGQGQNW